MTKKCVSCRYVLEGRKVMNPYLLVLYAWRESTTLNVRLRKINDQMGEKTTNLKGKLHISALELLKSACTLEGRNRIKFMSLITRSLIRTYIFQVARTSQISFTPSDSAQRPYPNSKIHEIKTGYWITSAYTVIYHLCLFCFLTVTICRR